jgi:hypothetical protein
VEAFKFLFVLPIFLALSSEKIEELV